LQFAISEWKNVSKKLAGRHLGRIFPVVRCVKAANQTFVLDVLGKKARVATFTAPGLSLFLDSERAVSGHPNREPCHHIGSGNDHPSA